MNTVKAASINCNAMNAQKDTSDRLDVLSRLDIKNIRNIKNNEPNSKCAQHILHTTHEYGPIQKITKPLYMGKKGPLLGTYERFHIYKITKEGIQLNDNYTDLHNPIYDKIMKIKNLQ
jgi:hypothetical protein